MNLKIVYLIYAKTDLDPVNAMFHPSLHPLHTPDGQASRRL